MSPGHPVRRRSPAAAAPARGTARPTAPGRLAAAASLLLLAAGAPAAAADAAAGRVKAGMCRTCHGLDGVARTPDAPHIAGESPIYLTRQLEAFRSGERRHEQMSIIAAGLDDADIADLVAWYASIRFTVQPPP